MADFTPDADFNDLTDRDHTVELIGYIDQITAATEVGRGQQKFQLFKFILNNNQTKRIQCLIWGNELIQRYRSNIKINEIIHIDGGHAKAVHQGAYQREDLNLVNFEIVIQRNTVIEFLGQHTLELPAFVAPADSSFDNIMEVGEAYIRIHGFIKTKFAVSPSRYNTMTFGCGSITNGVNKITVNIANYSPPLNFEKGSAVIVTGDVKMIGGILTISCQTSTDVEADVDVDPMDPLAVTRGNLLFKRRHEN